MKKLEEITEMLENIVEAVFNSKELTDIRVGELQGDVFCYDMLMNALLTIQSVFNEL